MALSFHLIFFYSKELGFDWREFKILEGHRAAVNVVEFDSSYIVSASGDRTLKYLLLKCLCLLVADRSAECGRRPLVTS